MYVAFRSLYTSIFAKEREREGLGERERGAVEMCTEMVYIAVGVSTHRSQFITAEAHCAAQV